MAPKTKKIKYRKRSSIFFKIWTAFTLLVLAAVLILGFAQRSIFIQTHKDEVAREVLRSGGLIENELDDYTQSGGADISAFLYSRGVAYEVLAFIVDGDGNVLYPEVALGARGDDAFDFSRRIVTLKEKLAMQNTTRVLYEDGGNFVYGCEYNGQANSYLYVYRAARLGDRVLTEYNARIILTSLFVLALSFALAGAVSGWLTRPLAEMTQKARRLGRGDFSVDFYGETYGAELYELAETLNFARDEIHKADRMQRELIANVSHDFKTPLTMIKSYASMIIEISGNNPEKRNKHAQVIIDEADRLASLVSDVLDLSKIRAGIETLEPKVFNLSAFVRQVLEKFEYLCESHGYSFEVDVEDGVLTRADEGKIGQVLYNLIGNAVNYTGDDKKVYVSLKTDENGAARFAVRDTGKGIKSEEIDTIWDRYYRSGETHKRPVQGTGLGLSIVKTVLEKHCFRFGVESQQGKGSTFFVLFPVWKRQ